MKPNSINIDGLTIGVDSAPIVIAEMSGNHNQSLERALEIVDAAADAGAHALKLQTYTADTMTIKASHGLFSIEDETSLWKGQNLYDLYKQAHTPWEWHKPIFERARSKGLLVFSSPFDNTSVDFLEELGVGVYKIASFENTDWPLLKKVASTGKPVIMSTGVAQLSDIEESVAVLRDNGCKDLVLLKCTSTYPATPESSNILTIPDMQEKFNCPVGLSDHTMGIGVAIASVALGASVIEKHFTLDRSDGGVDSAFSIEPAELKLLVEESERAWASLGKVSYEILEAEKINVQYKRSIYVVKDIAEGESLTADHLKVIRPADGMHSKHYDEVIGKPVKADIKAGTPLSFDHLQS